MTALAASTLPLELLYRGKVRDVYAVDDRRLLLVATDRVSAFDVVMPNAVPSKGAVLTQITAWWLRQLDGVVAHHMLAASARTIVEAVPDLAAFETRLDGRAMLCRRTEVIPIECVIRGYLAGTAWKEYQAHGTLAGVPLPSGLRESDPLDPPLFSPATKAYSGHDENIPASRVAEIVSADIAADLERLTRSVYDRGRRVAEHRGLFVADTKFEFGIADGELLLIDEVLTPDSSRFWPAAAYEPGRHQVSLDKQPLRDYLEGERAAGRWDGDAPGPELPRTLVAEMSARYLDVYSRLTGTHLKPASLS